MKIKTKKGEVILIDKNDYNKICNYTWSIDSCGYPSAMFKSKKTRLHRILIDVPKGKVCDHINQNKLDNRKANLRVTSYSKNTINAPIRKTNTSGYKGVSLDKRRGTYQVTVDRGDKRYYIGAFETALEGHITRNKFLERLSLDSDSDLGI